MPEMTLKVSDKIIQHLNNLSLGNTLNDNLKMLLVAEYRRRLAHYHLIDRQLTQKYQKDFDEFEKQQITKQQGYTWEVESDAMAWETAIDGMRTLQRQLAEIEGLL